MIDDVIAKSYTDSLRVIEEFLHDFRQAVRTDRDKPLPESAAELVARLATKDLLIYGPGEIPDE